MQARNIPSVSLGLVATSRDCFPLSLSETRRQAVAAACREMGCPVYEVSKIIESEEDLAPVLNELKENGCNALVVFLGNFGPETPETLLAKKFNGPVMFAAAAEENAHVLASARGDAFCGMLNASYNLNLRRVRAYIPPCPVGTATEIAKEIIDFLPIARILIGLSQLKIITFGPRPNDFLACNAPLQPLFSLGIEVQENSELDLYDSFLKHEKDPRIPSILKEMGEEICPGPYDGILPKLAQYEATLLDWAENNRGSAQYLAFANKCWPAFQPVFGFVPCFVNSRFASRLMPISCEVDIYGALSEYIIACAGETPPGLLDINNTVPQDLYQEEIAGKFDYRINELFMGFHCGNAPSCYLQQPQLKYMFLMHRTLEPNVPPNITRGTLEGDLAPGEITLFRLQSTADCKLKSYVAQGEILPVATRSFGSIGIFAVKEMSRFYRHVFIEKCFPHHGGVGFSKMGKPLFEAMKLLGISDLSFNQPKTMLYPGENPF